MEHRSSVGYDQAGAPNQGAGHMPTQPGLTGKAPLWRKPCTRSARCAINDMADGGPEEEDAEGWCGSKVLCAEIVPCSGKLTGRRTRGHTHLGVGDCRPFPQSNQHWFPCTFSAFCPLCRLHFLFPLPSAISAASGIRTCGMSSPSLGAPRPRGGDVASRVMPLPTDGLPIGPP